MQTFECEVAPIEGECYICCGDDAPRSLCACTDRFIHLECQHKQLELCSIYKCPVCMQPYKNIHTKVTIRFSSRGCVFLFSLIGFVMSVASAYGGVYLLVDRQNSDWGTEWRWLFGALMGILIVSIFVLWVFIVREFYEHRHGRWKLFQRVHAVTVLPVVNTV